MFTALSLDAGVFVVGASGFQGHSHLKYPLGIDRSGQHMRFYKDIIAEVDKPEKRSKNHYHEWSPESIKFYYDICTNNPFIRGQFYPTYYWEDLLAWAVTKLARNPSIIVDVGCANGNLIECVRKFYDKALIYGLDVSEECLQGAAARFKQDRRISFRVGSLERLPFDDNSVDLIICTEVLAHLFPETFKDSFSEVARVLKKDGYYLVSVPIGEKINLVCCPECGTVFTPYQVMIFEITRNDLSERLAQNGLELISFYDALDRSRPNNLPKKLLKAFIMNWFPGIAKRIFPKAGVTAFLARA